MIDRQRLADLHAAEEARFADTHPRSRAMAADARHSLLGGVPMAWMTRWPGAFPLFFDTASGARFTDVDGHEYVDFCLGDTGAMTGHALPQVAEAIHRQAQRGITTMLPSADAAWVGEELARRFGLPVWQMAMTATDANRFVLRFARFLTGRQKILVFDWCYHGSVDETLVTLGADGRPHPRGGNIGPQVHPEQTTVVVPFNDVPALEAALATGEIACVLAEPALTNIGIVLPDPGFHDVLRRLTREHGVLLAIDETHTICAGPGGATQAWGLEPDFFIIGKTIGGGMPAAAYGCTQAIADRLNVLLADKSIDTSGVGGTLTGNALALAAVRATLATTLRDEDFDVMIPMATAWTDGVQRTIDKYSLPWNVQQLGGRAEYWFCPPPRDGAAAAAAVDHELDAFMHLWAVNRGILLTPFHNMALMSPFHSMDDVDLHTDVFAEAVAALVA
ncbi:MAG: aspartate aminotransferase family protein [Acidimicrobiaceae bacterium]|nr:aspartate aminotransferase family protein [Ilumatobacter sp.]MCB9379229.1 aspartate aminotransferase family protein [Acidimicrobiaceae bacterium]MCO5330477.1 aspartate aminotransferase family protein [Ilumatobacteraceae bacterium]